MPISKEIIDHLRALQPKIVERMGECQVGDKYYDPYVAGGMSGFIERSDLQWSKESGMLRIPLAIDMENPERGLWGMVDWDLFSTLTPCEHGWYIFGMPDRKFVGWDSGWCSPYLALLKALAAQWGVEVKP